MTKHQMFDFPETIYNTLGDTTVSSNSALVGPIKWRYEFEQKTDPNAKPIKIVEFCSLNSPTLDVNTETSPSGEKTFTNGGYNGLACSCLETGDYSDCIHACMISDPYYVKFIANMLNSN
mmetsp:Transcript_21207/g.2844  ORF Transcript_21207/g.2844 Transcript_21207/m.2844 type:complete len:120 (-) Transcript_21207:164-523(-)